MNQRTHPISSKASNGSSSSGRAKRANASSATRPAIRPGRPASVRATGRGQATWWFYFKAALLLTALKLPFNALKVALLRWFGARVGRNVFISTDVWIDPTFPELLTIEDEVMVGVGVKIFLHEFDRDHFVAGTGRAPKRRDHRRFCADWPGRRNRRRGGRSRWRGG